MKVKRQKEDPKRKWWIQFGIAFTAAVASVVTLCLLETSNRQLQELSTALPILEASIRSKPAVDVDSASKKQGIVKTSEDKSPSFTSTAIADPMTEAFSNLPSSCPLSLSSSAESFLSQTVALKLIHEYAHQAIQTGKKPRFPPLLEKLMEKATSEQRYFVTVQIGGMDGKTGDPLYRMTELHKGSLAYWVPAVLEPVPSNFARLQATYDTHQRQRGLKCPLLLNSLISYSSPSNVDTAEEQTCDFCHFDDNSKDPACHDLPNLKKSEIGSMDCNRAVIKTGSCFTQSQLKCGTVEQALRSKNHANDDSFLSQNIIVLQVDVEGFEQQVLEGFLKDRLSMNLPLPPVIHFESKILKTRRKLEPVYALLRSKGYSIHEKYVDTLCLLGFQGGETSPGRMKVK